MVGSGGSGRGPQSTAEEAAEQEKARDRMLARHKLIEAMIRNNEHQLKNESARGGAEIDRARAVRDAELPGANESALVEVHNVTRRLRALEDEHERLVAEREWLNASLLEFESGPSSATHDKAGHS